MSESGDLTRWRTWYAQQLPYVRVADAVSPADAWARSSVAAQMWWYYRAKGPRRIRLALCPLARQAISQRASLSEDARARFLSSIDVVEGHFVGRVSEAEFNRARSRANNREMLANGRASEVSIEARGAYNVLRRTWDGVRRLFDEPLASPLLTDGLTSDGWEHHYGAALATVMPYDRVLTDNDLVALDLATYEGSVRQTKRGGIEAAWFPPDIKPETRQLLSRAPAWVETPTGWLYVRAAGEELSKAWPRW